MAKSIMHTTSNDGYPQLFLFSQTPGQDHGPCPESDFGPAPCPETGRFMGLFEEVTGWVVKFDESNTSQQRRNLVGMENELAEGTFSIVDMSNKWAAGKPTCHRANCDNIISIVDSLVGQLQSARNELNKLRSVVAAVAPDNIDDDDIVLIDSFVPTSGDLRRTDSDFEVHTSPVTTEFGDDFETSFDTSEEVANSSGTLVSPPFEGWTLGGATGINGDIYLDWRVDSDEQISISVGKIESDLGIGDEETTISVDPLTFEFQVRGSKELKAFYAWDSKSMSLLPLKANERCRRLLPGQAIVASTSYQLADAEIVGTREEDQIQHSGNQTSANSLSHADPDQLAGCFARQLDESDRVLVLKHN